MKKTLIVSAAVITFTFGGITASAAEGQDITGLMEEYQEKIKDMISDMDESDINEAFSFLKEKAAEGGSLTEADMQQAIEEGKEKLGVEIDDQYIEEMLGLVNSLEEMGFDSQELIEKAESMYQEYGADFVDHSQELVVEAVKDSIGTIIKNAIMEFFRMLGESVKNFFTNLF